MQVVTVAILAQGNLSSLSMLRRFLLISILPIRRIFVSSGENIGWYLADIDPTGTYNPNADKQPVIDVS